MKKLQQRSFFQWLLLILGLIILAGCSPRGSSKDTSSSLNGSTVPERETWEVCYLQGVRVGYAQTSVYRETLDGQPVVRTENRNQIEVKRYGQASQMKVRSTSLEKPSGELLRFESEMEMGPQPIRTAGRVVGKQLELETGSQGKKVSAVLDWSPEYGGFHALEQSLLRQPMKPGERRTLDSLLPGFNQLATIELSARDWEKVKLLEGTKELLRIDSVAILPNSKKIRQTVWIDKKGETLKTHADEMNLDSFRATKAEALKQNTGELLDINIETAVKLDRPIPHAHETKKIRYRLSLKDGDPAKVFPAGPTQQIVSPRPLGEGPGVRADMAELTVYAIRPDQRDGNRDAPAEQPSDADRRPNSMIQSDDPLVVSLAEKAAGTETDSWKTALALEKFVHGYIRLKDFSQVFASAAEAAETREGDCTEHAVLLAALCRAKKIPARVAIGLVYTSRPTKQGLSPEFAYHMWTEAFIDGHWIPIDATLGRGGIGAAHLKVADSNLDAASMYSSFLPVVQVVGRLKVEVLEAE